MKRDMNLIRHILLALEAESSGFAPQSLEIKGYTTEQIGYHTLLLMESGLIEGCTTTSLDDESPSAIATRLTWNGHEFLDAAGDKGRWEKALNIIQEKGGGAVTIGTLIQLLSALAKQAIGLD